MYDPLRPGTIWRAFTVALIVALACLIAFGILITWAHLR